MAQLVKLLDYISRYENDLTRYPTQFIRLKRSQWQRMKIQWENGTKHPMWDQLIEEEEPVEKRKFSSLFRFFSPRKEEAAIMEEKIVDEEEDDFGFDTNIVYTPKSMEHLRKLYLDQLFHFQLKWASSTLMDKSRVDSKYMRDSLLRSFTQSLPDSFLLFYHPIIKIQKAPVELDIIIMTPVECMCISVLEQEDLAAFFGNGDRFWLKKHGEKESKLLNPLIALNRNEKIVAKLLADKEIDFPVKKYLISRNGYIDYPNIAFDVEVIDKKTYENWFASLRKYDTPMKLKQFNAAQSLLDVGQTTAVSQYFDFDEKAEGEEENVNE